MMRKTDKKMDNQLRVALTDVCDVALKNFDGFQWLTHVVNYSNFLQTLKVVCIFDTNESLEDFFAVGGRKELDTLIGAKLSSLGIHLKKPEKHIAYDTEDACEQQHDGNWTKRLA